MLGRCVLNVAIDAAMLVYSHCFPEGLFFNYLLNALVWATRTLDGKGDGHGFGLIYGDVVRCWFPSKCLPDMQIFDFCFLICACVCVSSSFWWIWGISLFKHHQFTNCVKASPSPTAETCAKVNFELLKTQDGKLGMATIAWAILCWWLVDFCLWFIRNSAI